MADSLRVAGVILCGGESRRMGRDKASLPFGPETMLARVVRLLTPAARPVVVVAAPDQVVLQVDAVVVRDAAKGRGPWQGISAGLHALAGQADAAFVLGCDAPMLFSGWIARLKDLLGDHACAVPWIENHPQPLAALYRLDVVAEIDRLLDANGRPLSLFDQVATRFVQEDELRDIDPTFQTLRNLNSIEEYRLALSDAGFDLPPDVT